MGRDGEVRFANGAQLCAGAHQQSEGKETFKQYMHCTAHTCYP